MFQSDLYLITTNLNFNDSEKKNTKNPLENIHHHPLFNSLPNDKIFDWFKLKAFADVNVSEKLKFFVLGRVEIIVGKGENAGYQHFLLFPQICQNASFPGSLNVGIVW